MTKSLNKEKGQSVEHTLQQYLFFHLKRQQSKKESLD